MEIVLQAVRIIDSQGIHALTLQSIANGLGLSDVALLRHFRSKEEIVEALAQKVFFETVVSERFDLNLPLKTNLGSLMDAQFASFEAWPESTSIIFEEEIFREYPAIKDWFSERRMERHRRLAAMLREAQSKGLASSELSADAFATVFMGAMRMTVMDWREGGRKGSLREKANPLVSLLVRAVEV